MNHSRRRAAFLILAECTLVLLFACGGTSVATIDEDGGDASPCSASLCATNRVWNQATCACESLDEGGAELDADATTACPPIACPTGSVEGMVGGECACLLIDAGDATSPADAPDDETRPDSPQDAPHDSPVALDAPPYDAPSSDAPHASDSPYSYSSDSPTYDEPYPYSSDAPYDEGPSCAPTACGPGYEANPYCQCIACTNACPAGQSPAAGCGGCTPCAYKCPASFAYGTSCSCGPPGVDAGPNGVDAGGVSCLLEGNYSCSAGSWCQLGICPDNTTQYGCYCNHDGTASCDLTCPVPPPCTIPGEGTCPYGAQCVFDNCAADAASTELVCNCNSGGNASCYTSPCGALDAGISSEVDAGDGGVTCLLEGYYPCSAGSWCQLGLCPDNTTQYGCTCNADGTATCQLTCPAPPPCTIPGEGTCPYGTWCTFGTCAGNTGTQLSCYCESGGFASCSTVPCGAADGGPG